MRVEVTARASWPTHFTWKFYVQPGINGERFTDRSGFRGDPVMCVLGPELYQRELLHTALDRTGKEGIRWPRTATVKRHQEVTV